MSSAWTQRDEERFFQNFKRYTEPQERCRFVFLQAEALFERGSEELDEVAVRLLEYRFARIESPAAEAESWLLMARALDRLGREQDAIYAFQQCFAAQRRDPEQPRIGRIEYALFCVGWRLTPFFRVALVLLNELKEEPVTPFDVYRENAARAFMHLALGEKAEARARAQQAVWAEHKDPCGLRFRDGTTFHDGLVEIAGEGVLVN